MESELRATIHDNPTDPAPRLALAELWRGRPEADFVRILMEKPDTQSADRIKRWFEERLGWTKRLVDPICDCEHLTMMIIDPWLLRAFDRDYWPDKVAWHAGVVALARRRLNNARESPSIDAGMRTSLEEVASGTIGPVPSFYQSGDVEQDRHQANHRFAPAAIYLGQMICAIIHDAPGTGLGDGAIFEYDEQYHVFGWSWLGLPPLRPEAPSELRLAPGKKKEPGDPEGWPAAVVENRPWWRRLFCSVEAMNRFFPPGPRLDLGGGQFGVIAEGGDLFSRSCVWFVVGDAESANHLTVEEDRAAEIGDGGEFRRCLRRSRQG